MVSLELVVFSLAGHRNEMGRLLGVFHHHHGQAKVERDVGEGTQHGVGMQAVT